MTTNIRNLLSTTKKESPQSKLFRYGMNIYPMFFGTGGRVLFWSGDWSEVHLKLCRNLWTRNYVGTIFGGSMFSATDPFYMIMLMHMLGSKDYVVWDKSATIKFKRPSKEALYTKFHITPEIFNKIKSDITENGETTFVFTIQWYDKDLNVYSELERTVYAASKVFYKEKLAKRKQQQPS